MLTNFDEAKKSYKKGFISFNAVLDVASLISLNQHNIESDGRGVRAVKIFTRQTMTSISFTRILPNPNAMDDDGQLWDIGTMASLARNLLEGFLSLHFFGLEKITPDEAEIRYLLMQLHRNSEWLNIRKFTDPADPGLPEFEIGIAEQRLSITSHPFYESLTPEKRKRALNGNEMYKTKFDFEKELEACTHLRRDFRLLSNLVHPLPLSFERIDNDRGRGVINEIDTYYAVICLGVATKYLAASTIGIAEYFPEKLAKRFSKEIKSIRPYLKPEA